LIVHYLKLSVTVLGLALLAGCVNGGAQTNIGGPSAVNPDGSPVIGEARGE
jgi:hypothetical protein